MSTAIPGGIGLRLSGATANALILLALAHATAGCAVATTSGPPEPHVASMRTPATQVVESRVIHHPDGQTVVVRDAHGTDITVQRAPRYPPAHHYRDRPRWSDDRAGDAIMDERLGSRRAREMPAPPMSLRDEYRRRMLDRLDGLR